MLSCPDFSKGSFKDNEYGQEMSLYEIEQEILNEIKGIELDIWKPVIQGDVKLTLEHFENCSPRRLMKLNLVLDYKRQLEKESQERGQ